MKDNEYRSHYKWEEMRKKAALIQKENVDPVIDRIAEALIDAFELGREVEADSQMDLHKMGDS